MPHWGTAPGMIRGTDLILTVASRTLDELALEDGLVRLAPPMQVPAFNFVQVWHGRSHDDPAHAWLREQIRLASVARP